MVVLNTSLALRIQKNIEFNIMSLLQTVISLKHNFS